VAKSNIKASLSEVAEAWLRLDGKPFSLEMWPMHRALYDGHYRRTLLKTSRQVAKSTTLANFSITECSLIPHFATMYVSPTKEQTVKFSTSRVGKVMRYSPVISKRFLHPDLSDRVFHKQFTQGSEMYFSYAMDDGDRLRGPSTDRCMYDEVQDILFDPVIIVGNETMSDSDYAYETYSGTPKTMENTIQYLWEISTQTEWVMRCDACGTYQYIDSEKAIGKDGPICLKCKDYINPFTGKWIDINPQSDKNENEILKGFHINQLIMPRNVPAAMRKFGNEAEEKARSRWQRILTKYEENPISLVRNEVIGVSDAIGTRMITKEELYALCTPRELLQAPTPATLQGFAYTVGGVDWSGGGTKGVSRTVIWIWGFHARSQKLILLFYKVYPRMNPVHIIDEIALICSQYQVAMVVGDAGEGHVANETLRSKIGDHRVTQIQYGGTDKTIYFNGIDRYIANRTTLIDNYFLLLKRRGVEFGREDQMRVAIEDMLNVFEEVTSSGKKVWQHSAERPDDCLHAGLFGWIAHKIQANDLKFYQ
jgi:hypothetical protein